jgi:short-subunit dehydrogenase
MAPARGVTACRAIQGQAQTLDHRFVTPELFEDLRGVRVAHVNADRAADEDGDAARGASDHDPVVSRFEFRATGNPGRMETSSSRPLAVVTGATSGIGRELAKQFAEHGFDLIVAAEDAAIEDAARELGALGANAEAVQVDLRRPEGVEELHRRIRERARSVDAIALNAGIGMGGEFATQTELEQELAIVDLNCRSTVHLSKLVVRDMVAAGSGRILFTSSIASTMPGSYQAVYNASKSFVQSFAIALRDELEDTGVTVTSLMPGPTETEFFDRADMRDTRVGASDGKDDPSDVARQGFEAMMEGKERVVSASLVTKLQARASRFLPDSAKAALHRKMAEPGSAKKD